MKRLAFASILFAGVLSLAGCYTNPVTGRQAIIATSADQEVAMGAQAFADVQKAERVSHDRAANERVRRVGQRIAQAVATDMPGAQWEFTVFDSADVNAFALPGGKVGVYTGLLNLARTDDELAIVIGHEIGHVTARHGGERVTRAGALAAAGQGLAALGEAKYGSSPYLELFKVGYGVTSNVVGVLPHSRAQELEADHMGIVYAARAGYDPRVAVGFWQKMMAQKNAGGSNIFTKLLSSHPPDQERIDALAARMPEVLQIYQQARR